MTREQAQRYDVKNRCENSVVFGQANDVKANVGVDVRMDEPRDRRDERSGRMISKSAAARNNQLFGETSISLGL